MNENNLILALKHDLHKIRGIAHEADKHRIVPFSADKVASQMSRPPGNPKGKRVRELRRKDDNHYRISCITKERRYEQGNIDITTLAKHIRDLEKCEDAEGMHDKVLHENTLSLFNESYFYPYTSLKYHTLLVTSLVYNLSNGVDYNKIYLHITEPTKADYSTIYQDKELQLDLGQKEMQSKGRTKIPFYMDNGSVKGGRKEFGRSWNKLGEHIGVDRYLNSMLRRTSSWSIGLQLIEDWKKKDRGELK